MRSTPQARGGTPRSPRPMTRRVKDPTGRVDLLAARLLGRMVETYGNPALEVAFEELSPTVEGILTRYLGPRNPRIRNIRKYLKRGLEAQRRQAEFQTKVAAKVAERAARERARGQAA